MDDATIAAVTGVISSIFSAGVSHGIMKVKIERVEKDLEECRAKSEKFVTIDHFSDVIEPLKRGIEIVQKDIKQLLSISSKHPTQSSD